MLDDAVVEARALKRIAEAQGNEIEARGRDFTELRTALEERHAREEAALRILKMTEEETRRAEILEDKMHNRVTVDQMVEAMTVIDLPQHLRDKVLGKVEERIKARRTPPSAHTAAPTPTPPATPTEAAQSLLEGGGPTTLEGYRNLLLTL